MSLHRIAAALSITIASVITDTGCGSRGSISSVASHSQCGLGFEQCQRMPNG